MAVSVTVFAGKGKTGTHSRLAADGTDRNGYTGGSGPPVRGIALICSGKADDKPLLAGLPKDFRDGRFRLDRYEVISGR